MVSTPDLFVSLEFESIFVTCKVPFLCWYFCLREINQSGVILTELFFFVPLREHYYVNKENKG